MNSNNDPLHGITLKVMLTELQESLGWEGLSEQININCFKNDPSIKSSLTFLRRTPWARDKVERLYLKSKGVRPKRPTRPVKTVEQSTSAEPRTSNNPWSQATSKLKRSDS